MYQHIRIRIGSRNILGDRTNARRERVNIHGGRRPWCTKSVYRGRGGDRVSMDTVARSGRHGQKFTMGNERVVRGGRGNEKAKYVSGRRTSRDQGGRVMEVTEDREVLGGVSRQRKNKEKQWKRLGGRGT